MSLNVTKNSSFQNNWTITQSGQTVVLLILLVTKSVITWKQSIDCFRLHKTFKQSSTYHRYKTLQQLKRKNGFSIIMSPCLVFIISILTTTPQWMEAVPPTFLGCPLLFSSTHLYTWAQLFKTGLQSSVSSHSHPTKFFINF